MSIDAKDKLTAIKHDTIDMTKLARPCLVRAPSLIKFCYSVPKVVLIVMPARTCWMSAHMNITISLKLST